MIIIDDILDVENNIDDVKIVVFDLDDTLYNEIEYVKSGFLKIASEYPQIANMYDELLAAFNDGKQAIDFVLKKENLEKEKDRCLKIYRNQLPNIKMNQKLIEMIERIKKTKRIGIITDGRVEGQKSKIKALELDRLFDKIIITDELGGIEYRKPNIKAFIMMKDFFKCEFSDMVYIGDNINKDFIAPIKLGMKQIYFKNKEGMY